jgi:hypothetical protein
MSLGHVIKRMVNLFGIITTGALLSMCLFLAIFEPDATLTLKDIIGVPIIGAAADLPLLIFISRKEPSYRAMLFRMVAHCLVTGGVVFAVALWIGWLDLRQTLAVVFFAVTFVAVYIVAIFADYFKQKQESDKINLAIKERNLPPE